MVRRSTLALLAALVLLAGCGGSSDDGSEPAAKAVGKGRTSRFQGAVATPPKPAPALVLRDSRGKRVDIARYRGKAVLVTFIYVHCPDICPLIVGNLNTTLAKLGPQASKVKVIAVSTDPRGDRPAAVNRFVAAHRMKGKMDYLLGSKSQLGRVWKNWGIVAQPDKADPDKVEHSSPIYGISASGKITTLYPANFKPAMIVHDAPLLAAE
ncbi:MAG TPA: SCO family protein [Thermoleophilaceae bacterium]|jgi:protein SCO1/2